MRHHLVDLDLSPDTWAEVDAALAVLQAHFATLKSLTPSQRRSLPKMGGRSEAFCREAVNGFSQSPGVLPRNFDVQRYQRDMATFDALRPRLLLMMHLHEKLADTAMALGSDLMDSSLICYAALKANGRGQGLESLRRSLSTRFSRRREADTPQTEHGPAVDHVGAAGGPLVDQIDQIDQGADSVARPWHARIGLPRIPEDAEPASSSVPAAALSTTATTPLRSVTRNDREIA